MATHEKHSIPTIDAENVSVQVAGGGMVYIRHDGRTLSLTRDEAIHLMSVLSEVTR